MLKSIGVLLVVIVAVVGCVDPPEQSGDSVLDTSVPDAGIDDGGTVEPGTGGLSIEPSVVECPDGLAPAVRRIDAQGQVDGRGEIREESLFGIG